MNEITDLEKISSQVRRDIIRMVSDVASGHPGGSMGVTDFMVALYFKILKHNPENFTMEAKGEDVFYLSNGHISPVWYSVLARTGYFPVAELATFRKLGSRLQGHPSPCTGLKGIRVASGSLGQGLSCAIGHALAKKADGDTNIAYVLMGDGETQEGQVWEAAMFAAARKVDNLIAIIDWNNQQIDGTCDEVLALGDIHAKWSAFGWDVIEMNGHCFKDIFEKMALAKSKVGAGKPIMVLMKTQMGKGVDFMCGTNEFHGKAPSLVQKDTALAQLTETLGDY
ncbi:MAG: transketolase [Rikenellaceae bacterium]